MRESLEFGGGPRVKNWEKKDLIIAWHKYLLLCFPTLLGCPCTTVSTSISAGFGGCHRSFRHWTEGAHDCFSCEHRSRHKSIELTNWNLCFTMFLGIDQPPHWYYSLPENSLCLKTHESVNQMKWCELKSLNINKSNCQKWMTSEDISQNTHII